MFATTEDVATELGRPASSEAEEAQWQAWLDRVERAIRRGFARAGFDLDTQVEADNPTAQEVADVQVAAVVRKAQNPIWGRTSVSKTRSVDDASFTDTDRTEGLRNGADALDLLDSEWSRLLPQTTRARVFSVMPS